MTTTSSASRFRSTYTPKGRRDVLEMDFTARDGQTVTVTGPVLRTHLTTSTKPRPKGALHDKTTLQAMAVCEAVGMELWAVADQPRHYWATRGGRFFKVHHVIQRAIITTVPVDAWGTPVSLDTTHAAPAGL